MSAGTTIAILWKLGVLALAYVAIMIATWLIGATQYNGWITIIFIFLAIVLIAMGLNNAGVFSRKRQ